jgi:LmbE family N-acetylglucosaminyl deacetylase
VGIDRRELLSAAASASLPGLDGGAVASASPQHLVVIGAHPDDPESGCGGTIARYADAGHRITVIYLTRGESGVPGKSKPDTAKLRSAEAAAACAAMGVQQHRFLELPDGAVELNARVYAQARELMQQLAPTLLLAHWPLDTHRDHRAASMLGFDCWLGLKRKLPLYFFEVLAGSQTQGFHPTRYVDISTTEVKKQRAVMAHASQQPNEIWSAHQAMQRFRGMECGASSAEAFVPHLARELSP